MKPVCSACDKRMKWKVGISSFISAIWHFAEKENKALCEKVEKEVILRGFLRKG